MRVWLAFALACGLAHAQSFLQSQLEFKQIPVPEPIGQNSEFVLRYASQGTDYQPYPIYTSETEDGVIHVGWTAQHEGSGGSQNSKQRNIYITRLNPDGTLIANPHLLVTGYNSLRGMYVHSSHAQGDPYFYALLTWEFRNKTDNCIVLHRTNAAGTQQDKTCLDPERATDFVNGESSLSYGNWRKTKNMYVAYYKIHSGKPDAPPAYQHEGDAWLHIPEDTLVPELGLGWTSVYQGCSHGMQQRQAYSAIRGVHVSACASDRLPIQGVALNGGRDVQRAWGTVTGKHSAGLGDLVPVPGTGQMLLTFTAPGPLSLDKNTWGATYVGPGLATLNLEPYRDFLTQGSDIGVIKFKANDEADLMHSVDEAHDTKWVRYTEGIWEFGLHTTTWGEEGYLLAWIQSDERPPGVWAAYTTTRWDSYRYMLQVLDKDLNAVGTPFEISGNHMFMEHDRLLKLRNGNVVWFNPYVLDEVSGELERKYVGTGRAFRMTTLKCVAARAPGGTCTERQFVPTPRPTREIFTPAPAPPTPAPTPFPTLDGGYRDCSLFSIPDQPASVIEGRSFAQAAMSRCINDGKNCWGRFYKSESEPNLDAYGVDCYSQVNRDCQWVSNAASLRSSGFFYYTPPAEGYQCNLQLSTDAANSHEGTCESLSYEMGLPAGYGMDVALIFVNNCRQKRFNGNQNCYGYVFQDPANANRLAVLCRAQTQAVCLDHEASARADVPGSNALLCMQCQDQTQAGLSCNAADYANGGTPPPTTLAPTQAPRTTLPGETFPPTTTGAPTTTPLSTVPPATTRPPIQLSSLLSTTPRVIGTRPPAFDLPFEIPKQRPTKPEVSSTAFSNVSFETNAPPLASRPPFPIAVVLAQIRGRGSDPADCTQVNDAEGTANDASGSVISEGNRTAAAVLIPLVLVAIVALLYFYRLRVRQQLAAVAKRFYKVGTRKQVAVAAAGVCALTWLLLVIAASLSNWSSLQACGVDVLTAGPFTRCVREPSSSDLSCASTTFGPEICEDSVTDSGCGDPRGKTSVEATRGFVVLAILSLSVSGIAGAVDYFVYAFGNALWIAIAYWAPISSALWSFLAVLAWASYHNDVLEFDRVDSDTDAGFVLCVLGLVLSFVVALLFWGSTKTKAGQPAHITQQRKQITTSTKVDTTATKQAKYKPDGLGGMRRTYTAETPYARSTALMTSGGSSTTAGGASGTATPSTVVNMAPRPPVGTQAAR